MTFIALMTSGCVSDITIKISQPGSSSISQETNLAEVNVIDLRRPGIAASKREAAFGVPMGNITFQPPEAQLIKAVLEAKLSKLLNGAGITEKQSFSCDLIEFGVNTNTTALYWDVIGRIKLTLKHDGKAYDFLGTHTERTYVWPGEKIIRKVVNESLKQIISDLKPISKSM